MCVNWPVFKVKSPCVLVKTAVMVLPCGSRSSAAHTILE